MVAAATALVVLITLFTVHAKQPLKAASLFMPVNEFTVIQRQLEIVLSELKNVSDPKLRRQILLNIRQLLAEADRLMLEKADE